MRKWMQGLTATAVAGCLVAAFPQTALAANRTASPAKDIVYTVEAGNTIYGISLKFHTSETLLLKDNPSVTNPRLLQIGQRLRIPLLQRFHDHELHASKTTKHSVARKIVKHSKWVAKKRSLPRKKTWTVSEPRVRNTAYHVPLAASRIAEAIIRTGESYMGLHYTWGGNTPKTGFDCSGFTQYIFGVHGIHLPRTANEQFHVGRPVPLSQLKPGDLLFFRDTYNTPTGNMITHVAMYIGNGSALESSSVHNWGVMIIPNILQDPWYRIRYAGARQDF
ncbi:MAG: NlpC/P60 family protein [Alicyclobacillaceae bacterium]|nr:NlpC/P60 family protein [Alicyclobacillaceae bacterium]